MLRYLLFGSIIGISAFVMSVGCCPCGSDCETDSGTPSTTSTDATLENGAADDATQEDSEDVDGEIDVENAESPEGVVDAFFKAFFEGDRQGAFALLSKKARDSQRDQFAAEQSSTIRWQVAAKTPGRAGRVYVTVDVEDYTEEGDVITDSLTFETTRDDGAWRVAGFSVGDLTVDFEESSMYVHTKNRPNAEPIRVARENDGTVRR